MGIRHVISFSLLLYLLPYSSTDCPLKGMQNVCRKQGSNISVCDHKISPCEWMSETCYDMHNKEIPEGDCSTKKIFQAAGCGSLKPEHITPPEKSLVHLRLYHHWGTSGSEGRVNMIFPAPTWKKLRLQDTDVEKEGEADLCHQISLHFPINATLMYDCQMRQRLGNKTKNTLLTVQSDSGKGASYLFRIPPGYRINPEKTCPSDWHVFFYIHQDAIQKRKPVPVTIQSAPFGQAAYKVMLARCVDNKDEDEKSKDDVDKECQDFDVLDSRVEMKNTTDDLWTVNLMEITAGGKYIVRVQIVSDWCPQPKGCHVSVSPKFDIKSESTLAVTVLTSCIVLLLLISTVVLIHHLRKMNKKFLREMKNQHPTVLLVYHPESQASLHFVNTLANFLENTCCVCPLMADKEVVWKDPIQWTKTEMTNANRVLFIVPKDSEAQSVTILRDMWKVALNHCSGQEFTTNQEKKVAKLLLPTSGYVPWQICDAQRFELSHNPAAMATWLHSGSRLDQVFIWWPHIRSSTTKRITPTWQDVRLAANEMESPAELNSTLEQTPWLSSPEKDVSVTENVHDSISYCVSDDDLKNSCSASDDDDEEEASFENIGDPQIPGFNSMCRLQQVSGRSLPSSSTSSLKDYEDEWINC